MANGRLGKANISPLATTAVYTNTSGAEATVSIVAVAPLGTTMNLRIDDTTSAVEAITALVSETFLSRYISYNVENTTLGQTPTYVGRHQLIEIGSTGTVGFEFYDPSTSTTYTNRGNATSFLASSTWAALYPVALAEIATRPVQGFFNTTGTDSGTLIAGPLSTTFNTQGKYYQGTLLQSPGSLSGTYSRTLSYSAVGSAINQYGPEPTDDGYTYENYVFAVGMQSNRYMGGAYVNPVGGNSNDHSRTSDSTWIKIIASGGLPTPTSGRPYQYLKPVKNVMFMDGTTDSAPMGFRYMPPSLYQGAGSASGNMDRFLDRFLEDADARGLNVRINGTTAYKAGGNAVYFEYNPSDGNYYYAVRDATSTLYFYKIDPAVMVSSHSSSVTMRTVNLGSELDFMTLATGSLGATTIDKFNTLTTFRIQRVGASKWVLGIYRLDNEATQPEFLESTDLLNWTAPSPPSGTNYYAIEGDFVVESVSGAVTATGSNITTLAANGILESNTSMVQYERTGLVLSNNDRVLVQNSGQTNNLSVSVMGFEGV